MKYDVTKTRTGMINDQFVSKSVCTSWYHPMPHTLTTHTHTFLISGTDDFPPLPFISSSSVSLSLSLSVCLSVPRKHTQKHTHIQSAHMRSNSKVPGNANTLIPLHTFAGAYPYQCIPIHSTHSFTIRTHN